ncbi:MAG: bifunctional demethylmenaquinone methyltransferase/2-methoxy-6-polyprenyl-1,4-benzoquinol methylase UbiE [Candidatus Obscuribacterales bacterium]|nr:bifunctional demethylmenaquinone methyltransferase/2-methoxy-6-polyprenyl-1,4-benzoquinol methylase UbiE [Candidatus Obscuribacterales bacterium]
MTSFKLPTTEEKAAYVQNQFDRIARKYDLANDVISMGMHRLWKDRAIKELLTSQSGKYLDVCCGTGDLALTIASRSSFSGEIVGIDFSAEMLAVAKGRESSIRQNEQNPRLAPMNWIQGDALQLPFPDNSFDGAIVSFGLRNLTNYQSGIDEMARVVKPGGRVVNLDLGQPTMPVFTPFYLFYFHNIVPIIGEIIQGDRAAYTYLPESRKNYPAPPRLTEMFTNAGLSDVRWIPLACGSVALHAGTVR